MCETTVRSLVLEFDNTVVQDGGLRFTGVAFKIVVVMVCSVGAQDG